MLELKFILKGKNLIFAVTRNQKLYILISPLVPHFLFTIPYKFKKKVEQD